MAKFTYTATNAQGAEKSGVIESVNRAAALAKLRESGLYPSRIDEVKVAKPAAAKSAATAKRGGGLNMEIKIPVPKFLRRVKKKQVMVFTRQLATLIDAGVPLLRALQILEKQEQSGALKAMIGEMCESVEGGAPFAEALAQHPRVFDRLFVNMVRAGEVGGVLAVTLNRLAEFIEKAEKIKTKVTSAMVYPIVVLIMALGITGFLMVVVIPKFTDIFRDLMKGAEMPAVTQFVSNASDMLVHRFPLVLGIIVGAVVLHKLIGMTKPGRYLLDKIALSMPVFGTLLSKVSISRFTRTLGTLMSSDVQILQALNIVRDTAGNTVVARAIQSVHDSVKEGESVAAPMESAKIFPSMVVSMVMVGEETGRLSDMLVKIADSYDTEVDAAVDGLTSIIEPVLIIFLALVVGTIVVAMFMPLIDIISNLQG